MTKYPLISPQIIKTKMRKIIQWAAAFTLIALSTISANAQITCSFTVDKVKVCIGGTVQFTESISGLPASVTVNGRKWNYGNGNTSSTTDPNYIFTNYGNFTPTLTFYLSNGDSCVTATGLSITVYPLPVANYRITAPIEDTQCWEGNYFCLTDSSKRSPVNAKIVRRIMLWDDGSQDSVGADWNGSDQMCYTYPDPKALNYSPELIIIDTNGCVDTFRIQNYLRVNERLDPNFTTLFTRMCDSTPVPFTNSSRIKFKDVSYFSWEFGDGVVFKSSGNVPLNSNDQKMWDNFIHMYYKQGPFTAKLVIRSKYGCIDSFINQYAGDNVNLPLDPYVPEDTMCWDGNLVEFIQTPLFIPIPGKQQVYWIYNHPPPNNVDSGTWNPKHAFPSCGPKVVNLLVWQPPCTKLDTIDSIMLYGPMAKIENPPLVMIADTERHQCDVRDTVHFTNVSQICDVEGLHYYWDFDDNSNPHSINDTAWSDGYSVKDTIRVRWNSYLGRYDSTTVSKKIIFRGERISTIVVKTDTFTNPVNGQTDSNIYMVCSYGGATPSYRWHCDTIINGTDTIFKPRNTHFSRDWKPIHMYDSAEAPERCHTPKFNMKGFYLNSYQQEVWCESKNQVPFAMMNPRATGLTTSGQSCYGPMPPYGITFKWDKSKPGCTQQFVSICFDSACCRWPGDTLCWTPQTGFAIPPWSPFPVWPTQYKRPYFNICDPTGEGWVTVGLVIHNRLGQTDSNVSIGKYKRCSDTVWYHHQLRFVDLDPRFATTIVNPQYICPRSDVWFTMTDSIQDSIKSVGWIWADGSAHTDTIRRIYASQKDYKTHRYEYRWDENGDFIDSIPMDTSIYHDYILPTMKHYYKNRGKYKVNLVMTNTDNCVNVKRYTVIVGQQAAVYLGGSDTIVCTGGNPIEFQADLHYWHPIGPPVYPWDYDTTQYWLDPTLGGTRAVQLPFKPEKFIWLFDDTINPVSTSYFAKHRFSHTGIFDVRLCWTDSNSCKDTIHTNIYVEDVHAAFYYDKGSIACGQLTKFFDSSYTEGPCPSLGACVDTIIAWDWDFGDKKNGSIFKNPVHKYSYPGTYTIRLICTSTFGCMDTTYRKVTVKGPHPKAVVVGDTLGCVPFTARFSNQSDSVTTIFKWKFGDGVEMPTNGRNDVYHTYTNPGTYYVFLDGTGAIYDSTQAANLNCTYTYPDTPQHRAIIIRVLPRPRVNFTPPKPCKNDVARFINLSDTTYTSIIWEFGDGATGSYNRLTGDTLGSITHIYTRADTFYAKLRPTYTDTINKITCPSDTTLPIVVDSVMADFEIDSSGVPDFKFKNTSGNNTIAWHWSFDHPQSGADSISNKQHPSHNYGNDVSPVLGFNVCLTATNGRCFAKICKPVFNNFEVDIMIPNAFTPDGDNLNMTYKIFTKGLAKDVENFHLVILNRWGQKVFETKDPTQGWNGTNKGSGLDCPTGTYFYTLWWNWRVWPTIDKEPKKVDNYGDQTTWHRDPVDGTTGKASGTITLIRKN